MDHTHHIVMFCALRVECIFIFMKICDDVLCHNSYIILLLLPVNRNRGWRLVNLGIYVYFDVEWGRRYPTFSQRKEEEG